MVPILAVSRYLVHVYSELLEAITDRHVTSIFIYLNLFQFINIKLQVHQDQTSSAYALVMVLQKMVKKISRFIPPEKSYFPLALPSGNIIVLWEKRRCEYSYQNCCTFLSKLLKGSYGMTIFRPLVMGYLEIL